MAGEATSTEYTCAHEFYVNTARAGRLITRRHQPRILPAVDRLEPIHHTWTRDAQTSEVGMINHALLLKPAYVKNRKFWVFFQMYVSLKLDYKIEFYNKMDSGNGLQARFRVGKGISGFFW